ncbi:ADP-ribosyltransferase [Aeromonas schubertii]|uniref:ADP-ribosyltransferase n=1 Tax=Aeromonas schubertii TaxID=652 RepID=A0ABS7VFS9_9GAMM|nr:ADP-ribosyltransferase [Aeromonas schubertii]MBZ6068254.1 ADP-ribosyltransferase [Aeromonas schubertii]
MQIQGHHHVSPQVVEQSQTQASGRLGTVEARQVATPREAIQLAHRQEAPKAEGLLSRLGAAIARPFVALKEWLGKLLGSHSEVPAAPSADEFHRQQAELKSRLMAMALAPGLSGLDKTGELVDLTPEALASEHTRLATGNGALRSLVTALTGIHNSSQVEATRQQAALLLEKNLGGIPLQQWGTTGGQASEWVSRATPEQLNEVTGVLHAVMQEVQQLRHGVEREIKGEPIAEQPESGRVKAALTEQVPATRQTPATGYKQALDLISYQASYLLRDKGSLEVTLKSDDLNQLHQCIGDGSIHHGHLDKLKTLGDLQTVRALALSLAHGSDANGASLGGALDSLATSRPNQRLVLGGLMQFASQGDQAWAAQTAGKPEDRLDAGARLRFDTGRMKSELARLSAGEAAQVLQQLEGEFGDRAKTMCDFAVAQVSTFADSETSPEALLVSRLTRMGNLIGSVTDELKARLQVPQSANKETAMIDDASQLTALELAALDHIGVKPEYL